LEVLVTLRVFTAEKEKLGPLGGESLPFLLFFPFLVGMDGNCLPCCLMLDVTENSFPTNWRQGIVTTAHPLTLSLTAFSSSLALVLLIKAVRDTERDNIGTLGLLTSSQPFFKEKKKHKVLGWWP